MTSNVAERGLYKTADGWVQVVAGEQLRRVRAEAYMASGAQPSLALLPLRRTEADERGVVDQSGRVRHAQ